MIQHQYFRHMNTFWFHELCMMMYLIQPNLCKEMTDVINLHYGQHLNLIRLKKIVGTST